jgi:hypothetical protein
MEALKHLAKIVWPVEREDCDREFPADLWLK